MEIAILLGAVLSLFMAFILVRALLFRPYTEEDVPVFVVQVDGARAVKNLTQMIKCKTVSYDDISLEDEKEFDKFRELLKVSYPRVTEHCELSPVGRSGLLYLWKGKSSQRATVFMAHYDVVPAAEANWDRPPFAGVIEDGYLWGRGTLDTKGTLCGIMESAEQLISEGFVPENDIYLSFSGDEETNGASAAEIVEFLARKGIRPHMVLDEGGAVVEGVIPGVKGKIALVGTGEKGKLHLKFSIKSKGGHASAPPPHTPVGILAKAVCAIERSPMEFHLAKPVLEMFDILGRHSSYGFKVVFANLKLFGPLLDLATRRMGGEINALVRTTAAFTKMAASDAVNVFPPMASVEGDFRLMEGDTRDSVIRAMEKRIGNDEVKVEAVSAIEVCAFSEIGTEPWIRLKEGIRQVWPGTLVSPYLMIACSDSRHFTRICDNVLRFSAMELSSEERKSIHGNNERIPLTKIETTVKFFICMMKKS